MDHFHLSNSFYQFNFSTSLTGHGYIYYANLYSSNSHFLDIVLNFVAVTGIIVAFLLFLAHLCAIRLAQTHLYKTVSLADYQPKSASSLCCRIINRIETIFVYPFKQLSKHLTRMQTILCGTMHRTSSPKNVIVRIPRHKTNTSCSENKNQTSWPGVTILKPLAGLDVNLESNLLSFFNLDYPTYEVLFCLAEPDDPARLIVEKLIAMHPNVQARLVLVSKTVGVNPKINNLQAGYEVASYALLMISDSGIWMRPDTLTDMIITLNSEENIGLVHQIPYLKPYTGSYAPEISNYGLMNKSKHHSYPAQLNYQCLRSQCLKSSIGSAKDYFQVIPEQPTFSWVVQLVFFSCWHAKIYLCAGFLNMSCVTGMSCLMRKSVLDQIHGFKSFGCYLAEDFFISKYFTDEGWQIRIAHQPAWQNSPSPDLYQFYSRISRWSQLRLSMVFLTFALEPFSRCLPTALLSAFSFAYMFPDFIDPGVYFLCYILIWFLLDYILMRCMYPPATPFCITKLEYFVAWLFSELIAIPLHFNAAFSREIHWRKKRYRVHWGGISEQVQIISSRQHSKNSQGESLV